MANMSFKGLDETIMELERLMNRSNKILRGTLGEGAEYLADEIKDALNSMPTHPSGIWATSKEPFVGATEHEKEKIIDNFGISKFKEKNGNISTSIGFGGYITTNEWKYEQTRPTGMVMQCIEYGNSFRSAWHGITKARDKAKAEVEAKMQKYLDDAIDNIAGKD